MHKDQVDVKENAGLISYWVLFWVINLLTTFSAELIQSIENAVRTIFYKIYNNFSVKALEAIDKSVGKNKGE